MKTLGLLAAAILPGAVAVGTDGAAEGTNFIGARRSAERRGGVSETSRTRAALSKPFLPLRRRETAARCCCWARSRAWAVRGKERFGSGVSGALTRSGVTPRGHRAASSPRFPALFVPTDAFCADVQTDFSGCIRDFNAQQTTAGQQDWIQAEGRGMAAMLSFPFRPSGRFQRKSYISSENCRGEK